MDHSQLTGKIAINIGQSEKLTQFIMTESEKLTTVMADGGVPFDAVTSMCHMYQSAVIRTAEKSGDDHAIANITAETFMACYLAMKEKKEAEKQVAETDTGSFAFAVSGGSDIVHRFITDQSTQLVTGLLEAGNPTKRVTAMCGYYQKQVLRIAEESGDHYAIANHTADTFMAFVQKELAREKQEAEADTIPPDSETEEGIKGYDVRNILCVCDGSVSMDIILYICVIGRRDNCRRRR